MMHMANCPIPSVRTKRQCLPPALAGPNHPSVPMKVRHLPPGNLDLRALKDNHGIPDLSGRLGVLYADVMEGSGDEAVDFAAVAGQVGEELVYRRLEFGKRREVLVVERLLLEQPPEPLDQIEVRCIGRQVNQLDPAPFAGGVSLDLGRVVVAGIVQHHADRARRRMPRLPMIKQLDHLGAGDLVRLAVHDFAARPDRGDDPVSRGLRRCGQRGARRLCPVIAQLRAWPEELSPR